MRIDNVIGLDNVKPRLTTSINKHVFVTVALIRHIKVSETHLAVLSSVKNLISHQSEAFLANSCCNILRLPHEKFIVLALIGSDLHVYRHKDIVDNRMILKSSVIILFQIF